ncbi:hypothetical protein ACO0LB_09940 [Undibacterium sp. SXout7W]|uniref:hypothetical protein n=1 Tax=Undibacterium sp. SXout7W TaxID=3413049 RepID=UPI003BF1224C
MDEIKHYIDLASIAATIGSLAGMLPPLAALASILWIAFQFYHSAPMKEWRAERKERLKNEQI